METSDRNDERILPESSRVLRQPSADELPPQPAANLMPRGANGAADAEERAFLSAQLRKARSLLEYAAETGIEVEATTQLAVLGGAHELEDGWTQEKADKIVTALTTLAALVRPVSAESLAIDSASAKRQIRMYSAVMWILGVILVPFSIFNFCASRLSESIQADLRVAQSLADKLSSELYQSSSTNATVREPVKTFPVGVTPAGVVQDLAQFAYAIRAVAAHGSKLNFFVGYLEREPWEAARPNGRRSSPFELKADLTDFVTEFQRSLQHYQRIRYAAQSAQTDAANFYGAVLNCLLPMLYAILGSLAYLLRMFEQQLKQRTFTQADGHTARFAIAAIGGFVVGLFNLNIASEMLGSPGQAASISPLAIAFMVGYAADVFFSFLEGLIQTFGRRRESAPSTT